jgi:two-component system chemotaxis response regulator CheY
MSDLLVSDLLILLIEPSSTQSKVVCGYLNDMGIDNVDRVESAAQAFEQMQRIEPDLIISAMHLPDMTGTDLLLQMREDDTYAHIPFMLISSETHYRYLEPIRQAGAIAILPKPFDIEQLRSALRNTLEYIDPEIVDTGDMLPEEVRILLVDDSRMARRHIRRVLENMGFEDITEAENGIEGVEMVRNQEFDLIVTDYNMPEMDGKEFIQYVREESAQAGIPIMMVTSMSDESRLAMVQQVGVSAICDKPFDPGNIRTVISSLMK